MPKVANRIYNKSDEQFIIVQATIEANKQYMKSKKQGSDKKMMKLIEDFKVMLASTTKSFMDQIKISKYFPYQQDSKKSQEPTTVVPANRRDPPLDGGHYTKIGGMWTLKHDIRPQKLYELLIKT